VKALFATLRDDELADPDLSSERLLFRLYHERGVRVFEPLELEERCTCSAERIEAMLRDNFTSEEREDMAVDGEIEVVCEFCSADYHFKPQEFEDNSRDN
jgi:molecular chaperone Hsp33